MFPLLLLYIVSTASAAIDRQAVVQRHNPSILYTGGSVDSLAVLSLGNGAFAFNAGLTGTQALNDSYAAEFDLNTMSDWAFHSLPFSDAAPNAGIDTFNYTFYNTATGASSQRLVPYPSGTNMSGAVNSWAFNNPHRISLFQLSLRTYDPARGLTAPIAAADLANPTHQVLDMWGGALSGVVTLKSNLTLRTTTVVDPDIDSVGLRLEQTSSPAASPLVAARLAFPYATGPWGPQVGEWSPSYDGHHVSRLVAYSADSITIARIMDEDSYRVDCRWSNSAENAWVMVRAGPHVFDLVPTTSNPPLTLEIVCLATPTNLSYPVGSWMPWMVEKIATTNTFLQQGLRSFEETRAAAADAWRDFWTTGAFVDLASATTDPAAFELERRVILSLYLTRINSAGAAPPQETGLLCNSWNGKHHSEMRFWHQAHWAMWNRTDLLHRTDGFYIDYLPNATATATYQGYDGARWPKQVATVNNRAGIDAKWYGLDYQPFPFGNSSDYGNLMLWESPNGVGPLLVWQMPHVIWLADMQRHVANATGGATAAMEVVKFQAQLVDSTARFLASFPYWNATAAAYYMGPPLLGGEEMGDIMRILNPTFELVYFALGLDIANQWRVLQGLQKNATWDAMAGQFARLFIDPQTQPSNPAYSNNYECACLYVDSSACPAGRYGNKDQCGPRQSHPMALAILGMINGRRWGDKYGVVLAVLNNTVAGVLNTWDWGDPGRGTNVWGWDFPLLALSQARMNWSPNAVVQTLLKDVLKNLYLPNGINFQGGGLPAYFPGNGALLQAVAGMAAGFQGNCVDGECQHVPGIGFPAQWGARAEGFVADLI